MRRIAALLKTELGDKGELYCQSSVNYTILFKTCDEAEVSQYYQTVFDLCAAGIKTNVGTVPIILSGGAMSTGSDRIPIEKIRSGLVFAVEESQYYHRNRLVFYQHLDNTVSGTNIDLLAKIHADALANMEYFRLRYQPIVDVQSGLVVGAEALLRWVHPVYGEVPPGKFISFIENDPCYYRLGLGIVEQAVRDAVEIRELIPDFRININITVLQLQNEHFADNIFEILNRYGFPPEGIVLELTERCKEMDGSFLAKKIAELRGRGFLVAFDDLGTGYSTINLLMDIPVDEIKLDREFVNELATRENYQFFVRALVLGSNSLGNNYSICFEGVETTETLKLIRGFGNFLAQGYYFSRPLLIDEFTDYIRKQQAQ